ncbi:MAG: hypothetical protein H5U38_00095 [Calditrichaeota bacterium]|nr:hypothetical protein [Calditrichota bacterium]
MMRRCGVVLIWCLLVGAATAQLRQQSQPLDLAKELRTPATPRFGGLLGLDPSRLHLSHSYTLSYFSLGGQSFAQGVYLNTIEYAVSQPLQVRLQWGMAHSPLQNFGVGSVLANGPFVSAAEIQYRPSSKFSLGVQYRALPAYWLSRPAGLHQEGWQENP